MKHAKLVLAVGAAICAFAAPAQSAVTVDTSKCSSLSVIGNSCLFNGLNLANAADVAAVQSAYNTLYNPDLDLVSLGLQTDASGSGNKTGSWSTPGFSVQYLAVSGGNYTMLYYLGGVSSGNWSTAGIVNNGGQQPGLSHLAFLGTTAVPEPASWAMLIAGLGAVGFALRRRTQTTRVSFA